MVHGFITSLSRLIKLLLNKREEKLKNKWKKINLSLTDKFFSFFSSSDKRNYKPEKPDPRYIGSTIVFEGMPGTGKTYKGFKFACAAAFHYRLPIIAQDIRGDVGVYKKAMIDSLSQKKDEESKAKVRFLSNPKTCKTLSASKNDVSQLMALIEHYKEKNRKAKVRKPECYLFIDEGGVLRRDDEDFWNIAAGFRNSGITAYTTIHKDTDISRVGRQCIRAVILEKSYEGEVEFFGVKINASEVPPPMSDEIAYIDSVDRTVKRFAFDGDDPLEAILPDHEVLVHPVQPTYVERMVF